MPEIDEALRVLRGDVGEAAHKAPDPIRSFEAKGRNGEQPWFTSSAGINYTSETDQMTGDMIIRSYQNVYEILEANQAMFNENKGYSPDKTMQRIASIPLDVRNRVMIDTGGQVDLFRPETDERYYKKFVNDIDNRKFRTAGGRI